MKKSEWKNWKKQHSKNIEALICFAKVNQPEWYADNIVEQANIPSMLIPVIEEHDWKTVVTYLSEAAKYPDEKYYGINKFSGCLEKINWENYIDSLEESLNTSNFFEN